ncbi:MAG: hypothetical protein ACPGFC_04890, partial [Paracoccaceae bacterium]
RCSVTTWRSGSGIRRIAVARRARRSSRSALAAVMSGAYRPTKEERLAVLVCGGNIAPDPLM